ncbi:MAG TPA: tRNA (adenosine(37)-N6)-threonylcarbamoyltransferase complex dimerization subunit type 1 TsaB [Candidatus Dormibacteraeota bacterium]|nr:tRNA (adenosine(37)-N6)-threonylcarbamoyltransferase complex dimerization subunit type 1 TsaB [Candidatus Dormibacteraeota bacterium]
MLLLALDTSSPSGSIAVLRDDNLMGVIGTASGEIYSSRIFRHLEFLLGELSLRLEEFDVFAVAAGPGSFTGLRVGLAAVKGWAEVYGKPIAAVSALEAVAMQSRSRAATVVSVMDARRKEFYWGIYGRKEANAGMRLVLKNHEVVGTREDFVRAVSNCGAESDLAIVTPSPAMVNEALAQSENNGGGASRALVDRVSPILAPEIGYLGWLQAPEGQLADALTLDANYIRRSDAELHWKGSAGS